MEKLFISTNKQNLFNCYTKEQMGAEAVISEAEFYEEPEKYVGVKYIFSTWNMPSFSEQEIKKYLPDLKAVFYAAGTVGYFAEPFLKCGVRIFSAWKANAVPVAEFTAAQIILSNKGYFQLSEKYRSGWEKASSYGNSFSGNYHTRVGLIGLGQISQKVIELLRPYDLEIYVYSKHLTEQAAGEMKVIKADLPEIFEKCQTISNHLANKPDTVGMLNKSLKLPTPFGVLNLEKSIL